MNLLLRRAITPIFVMLLGVFVTTTDALAASCGANQYVGYDGSTCQTCPSGTDFYKPMVASCSNGTLTCKAWAYKVRKTSSSNELVCFPCPGINSSDLYVQQYTGALDGDQYMNAATTWQTSSRCTLIQSRANDGSGCEMNVKYVPSSECITAKKYSTASVPTGNGVDVDAEAVSMQACTYTRTVQYKNAIAGYRLSSTSYGNSCVACGTNEWSNGGNITSCSQCPYYTSNSMGSPYGDWGDCKAIMDGFTTSEVLGSQGVGAGSICTSGSTNTNTKGTYSTGLCIFDGSSNTNAWVLTVTKGSYCQTNIQGGLTSSICNNVIHCSGSECQGCNEYGEWASYFGCSQNSISTTSATVTCPDLYSAQKFAAAVVTAGSSGCITQCMPY
ncbi:MAG: hypothetical protein J6S74_04035 [Alphaproteobacteria bacterium]|nr:hypothetical protein [Alphaproteobacteria bacterium]